MKKLYFVSFFLGLVFGLAVVFLPSVMTGGLFAPPSDLVSLTIYWVVYVVILVSLFYFWKPDIREKRRLVTFILLNGLGFYSALAILIIVVYTAVSNWRVVF